MLPYWLLFTVWAAGAVQAERRVGRDPRIIFFITAAVFTALMVGLRFEVGGDWGAYQKMYENIFFLDLPAALKITDPGYAALNWLSAQVGLGVTLVNLICAALFTGGVARLAWRQPNPALAMLVGVPYLTIVVAMGYTRQAAAIGVICFAIADASERRLIRLVVLIGIATLLHKTAILLLPITLVPVFRRSALFSIFGAIVFLVLFIFVLKDSSDALISNYVKGDYDSQGALIRVLMNIFAAILFLVFRKRISMPAFQKSFWTTNAILAILSIFAFLAASASSGVDRVSLYIIPLQMVTYSRFPYLFGKNEKGSPFAIVAVILYSFLVQFVWLNFADNANFWVPYKFSML